MDPEASESENFGQGSLWFHFEFLVGICWVIDLASGDKGDGGKAFARAKLTTPATRDGKIAALDAIYRCLSSRRACHVV